MRFLNTPFKQAVAVLVVAYVVIEFGIAYVPQLVGLASAPVPNTVVAQYMLTVLVGVLLWVSGDEERWTAFKRPIQDVMVNPDRKVARAAGMITIPVLVALVVYGQVKPSISAPPSFRAIHPAPPTSISFRGETMRLAGLENPLRHEGSLDEHIEEGKRIYYQNCLACHGDALNGLGHYASAFNPTPLNFQDIGTIAQLTESFVFWRIAKGGVGLPNEGTPWNSAMPVWEDFLTEKEIWSVILFIYDQADKTPRTWEEAADEGESQ